MNGVTTEEFFNRGLVNKKLLEDNYRNLPKIFQLNSKKNHKRFLLTLLGLGFLGLLRGGIRPPHFLKNGITYKAEIW